MRLIDLSHPIGAGTPVYPGDEPVSLSPLKKLDRDGYAAFSLRTGLHAGTHIDFPMHLTPDARTCADFPPESFIGEGMLIDARGERTISPRPGYREADFSGKIVLLYTGFDSKWGSPEYFTEHPVMDPELAEFFARSGVKMVGMDTPSPDAPPFEAHKILLSAGVLILENLTGMGAVPAGARFEVVALPPPYAAEAGPVRVVCRVL